MPARQVKNKWLYFQPFPSPSGHEDTLLFLNVKGDENLMRSSTDYVFEEGTLFRTLVWPLERMALLHLYYMQRCCPKSEKAPSVTDRPFSILPEAKWPQIKRTPSIWA